MIEASATPLPDPLEYPRPSDVAVSFDLLGLLDDNGDTPDLPDEELVAGLVEQAAETLYELIQESICIDRVALRFERSGATPDYMEMGIALRAEQKVLHADYGAALADVGLLLGEDAASDLADWLERLAAGQRDHRPAASPEAPGDYSGGP